MATVWFPVSLSTRFLSSTLLPCSFHGPPIKRNSRKKGTLITKGLLRNQVNHKRPGGASSRCAALGGSTQGLERQEGCYRGLRT